MSTGKVWLVGAGPGDPGLLTLKGKRAIERCGILLHDPDISVALLALAPPDCARVVSTARTPTEDAAAILHYAAGGSNVCRLAGGDPFAFGTGGAAAHALRAAGVRFAVVSGIAPALAAAAYAGIPLVAGSADALTIAARPADRLDPQTTLVLTALEHLPATIAGLAAAGVPADTPVALVRDATTPTQATLVATLATVVAEAERTQFAAPAFAIFGDAVRRRDARRWYDSGPLFGKRVLITRPGGAADTFAEAVREAGAEPILAPTIAIGPPDVPAAAEAAVGRVRHYAWVVFTSASGVDAFFDILSERGEDARAFGDAKLAAIGPKTATALSQRGLRVDFMPSTFVNEAVAEGLIARTATGDRILVFRAQEARDVLPEGLRDAGRNPEVVAAYRTRFVDDPGLRAKAERADVVTFTSASTVQGFVYNLPDAARILQPKVVAAIGPVTAQTALALGIRVDAIPDDYTTEGLLAVLGTMRL